MSLPVGSMLQTGREISGNKSDKTIKRKGEEAGREERRVGGKA